MVKIINISGQDRILERKTREMYDITCEEMRDFEVKLTNESYALIVVDNPNKTGKRDCLGFVVMPFFNSIQVTTRDFFDPAIRVAERYEKRGFGEFSVEIKY